MYQVYRVMGLFISHTHNQCSRALNQISPRNQVTWVTGERVNLHGSYLVTVKLCIHAADSNQITHLCLFQLYSDGKL